MKKSTCDRPPAWSVIGWTVLAVVLAGCAPSGYDETEFPETAAYWLCNRNAECDAGGYAASFFDRADCERSYTEAMQETADLFDKIDCDYDAGGAESAIDTLRQMSCGDWYEGKYLEDIDRIWDCPL